MFYPCKSYKSEPYSKSIVIGLTAENNNPVMPCKLSFIFQVCHGDIKLENIMITSWNWVLLVDFASFKPTYLPEDNPADFSYFFDTSRRRTCYIAPER